MGPINIMFRFEDPTYLYLLVAVPLLWLVRVMAQRRRRKRLRQLGDPTLIALLTPGYSRSRKAVKFWLLQAAVALLAVIMARPQLAGQPSTDKREGIETIICLDISNSMLAEDVKPSRLERSKLLVEDLVNHFENDKIGLIVFAGDAFVQLPITNDYVSAKMFLDDIDPSLIQSQGTDIGGALQLAANSFTRDTQTGKAIIVITDGEDHEGQAEEMATAARKQGINIYMLGIGSTAGAPIPTGDGYLKDRSGEIVMSRLNESMCRQVAAAGKGIYMHVDNSANAERRLDAEMAKLQKGEIGGVVYSQYSEQYQAVALLVVVLLVIEALLSEVNKDRSRLWAKVSLHPSHLLHHKQAALLTLLCLSPLAALLSPTLAQTDRHFIREGNLEFHNQKYVEAETSYRQALAQNGRNARALYNLGCALQAQQKDSAAMDCYRQAAELEPNKTIRSRSFHNLGVVFQRQQNYGEAIEAYKDCLRLNPADEDARYNLVLCKRQQQQQKQNPQSDQQKDNKQQKDKKKDEQDKKKDEQKKDQQKDKQKQQKRDDQMSRENAEQLLNAAMQEERATQDKLKRAMQQPSNRNLEKNW